jgi:Uma2 family endonuclease
MATVARIGPADHGRAMTWDEFRTGDYEEGYRYELIDGQLYVSPRAELPEGRVEHWIHCNLLWYSEGHPEVINFVYSKTCVFVPGRRGVTAPEPDVAAYHQFPLERDFNEVRWQDVSPVLVVEVLCLDDPDKDLVRNVQLYRQVPSIREYWLLDTRDDPNRPSMTVYRRWGRRWRIIPLHYGDRYTTRLLLGFGLVIDPRS